MFRFSISHVWVFYISPLMFPFYREECPLGTNVPFTNIPVLLIHICSFLLTNILYHQFRHYTTFAAYLLLMMTVFRLQKIVSPTGTSPNELSPNIGIVVKFAITVRE